MQSFGLGDFVFVVGEDEIFSADVNIYCLTEDMFYHRGAFQMPAGTAATPGTGPAKLAFGGAFPQSKVNRIFFQGCQSILIYHLLSGADKQLLQILLA